MALRPSPSSSTAAGCRTCRLPGPEVEAFVHGAEVEGIHLRAGPVRPGRAALERAAQRLPHRGARPGLRAGEEERHHRPDRRQGRVRLPPARAVRGGAGARPGRGAGRLRGVRPGPARHHRQSGRRARSSPRRGWWPGTGRTRTWSWRPTRARPPSPTWPTPSAMSTASGWATPSRRVGRTATTTRPWASPPGGPGWRCAATSTSSGSTCRPIRSGWSASATCPATSSATGCCCSETIRLVAAFDHRHVFLDPDPDPAASFAERRRLAALPRSSWADYRPSSSSPTGGGVWPRHAKAVPLAPPCAAGPGGRRRGARARPS